MSENEQMVKLSAVYDLLAAERIKIKEYLVDERTSADQKVGLEFQLAEVENLEQTLDQAVRMGGF